MDNQYDKLMEASNLTSLLEKILQEGLGMLKSIQYV